MAVFALAVKHMLYYDSSMTMNWEDTKQAFARRNAEIFELRTKQGLTFEAIAEKIGISNARVQAICKKLKNENPPNRKPARQGSRKRP